MKRALILVDIQQDFLARLADSQDTQRFLRNTSHLLRCLRSQATVIHVHTVVKADASDCMPHWRDLPVLPCIEGSEGAGTPDLLAPAPGEPVFHKQFFDAFSNPDLLGYLRDEDITDLVVAGLYTHACVRETVLSGYQHGFGVAVARDCIASTELLHATVTIEYLQKRGVVFPANNELLGDSGTTGIEEHLVRPVSYDGRWQIAGHGESDGMLHRNPASTSEILYKASYASAGTVRKTITSAIKARHAWGKPGIESRSALLLRWLELVESASAEFSSLMAREVGKTQQDSEEEINRALSQAKANIEFHQRVESAGGNLELANEALGLVAIITPWNNPLAIPLSKIVSALVYGNVVLWKPAPESTDCSLLLAELATKAGLPEGVLCVLFGGAVTAREITRQEEVQAVSFTGSISAGKSLKALCDVYDKPFQGELGGNNAAVVLADASLPGAVKDLLPSVFGYSGQRCTAIRRIVIEEPVYDEFCPLFLEAVDGLEPGDLSASGAFLSPLISRASLERTLEGISEARSLGAQVLAGGSAITGLPEGNWLEPTVMADVPDNCSLYREESFAPVVILEQVASLEEALNTCNKVSQGLLAAVFTSSETSCQRFAREVEAGLVNLGGGRPAFSPHAPFGGRKDSQIGLPEHGTWDRMFYSRPKAIYRS